MSRMHCLDWFTLRVRSPRSPKSRATDPFCRRLNIEPLEHRRLLATLAVNSPLDNTNAGDGLVTLREAIVAANSDTTTDLGETGAGADTILFDFGHDGPETIFLSLGEIEITASLTIDGFDRNLVTVDAQQSSRIFHVTTATGDVAFTGVTLTGGRTIGNNGPGEVTFKGGVIRSLTTGGLTIEQSTISGNSTIGVGADGGAIYAYGSVALTASIVSGNSTAGNGAEGGAIYARGDVTLLQSTVSGNRTTADFADGGGIYSRGDILLTESTVSDNDTMGTAAEGGGTFARGDISLLRSTVNANTTAGISAHGGGIHARGAVMVSESTISGNSTSGDGADGGGVYAQGDVTLFQSTVSGNSVGFRSDGGGVFTFGAVTLTHSTVTNNHASYTNATGGIKGNSSSPAVTITHSIVAGNTAGGDMPDIDPSSASLAVDYSLIGDTSGTSIDDSTGVGNILNEEPRLAGLAHSGGLTRTHALLPGSLAIDAGDPFITFDPSEFDQRGASFVRVIDGNGNGTAAIDIGAYESQGVPSFSPGDYNQNGIVDAADYTVWRDGLGVTYTQEDYDVWKAHFGEGIVITSAAEASATGILDELESGRAEHAVKLPITIQGEMFDGGTSLQSVGARPERRYSPTRFVRDKVPPPFSTGARDPQHAERRDEALLAWSVKWLDAERTSRDDDDATAGQRPPGPGSGLLIDAIDEVFFTQSADSIRS